MASAGSTVSVSSIYTPSVSIGTETGEVHVSNLIVSERFSSSSISGSIGIGTNIPQSVTSGYGYIWVTDSGGTVSYIDPSNPTVIKGTVNGFTLPSAITSGYGYIWVTDENDTVSYIDPSNPTGIKGKINGITPLTDITDITSGYGYIWFTDSDGTVSYIDPFDPTVIKGKINVTFPSAITSGYGYIWVANDNGTVSYIDPSDIRTTPNGTISGFTFPSAITSGYGYIWVANGNGTVSYIDPSDIRTTPNGTISGFTLPSAITSGYGYIWVADDNGTVSYIDPSNPTGIKGTINGFTHPSAITSGYGYIWVTDITTRLVSYIKIGTLTSQDIETGSLEVRDKTTLFGDVEIVNSSLAITGRGSITCDRMNTNIFSSESAKVSLFAFGIPANSIRDDMVSDNIGNIFTTGRDRKIYRANVYSKEISSTTPSYPHDPISITYGGGFIWVCGWNGVISKINPTTLESIDIYTPNPPAIRDEYGAYSIAYTIVNGVEYLWGCFLGDGKMFVLNITSGVMYQTVGYNNSEFRKTLIVGDYAWTSNYVFIDTPSRYGVYYRSTTISIPTADNWTPNGPVTFSDAKARCIDMVATGDAQSIWVITCTFVTAVQASTSTTNRIRRIDVNTKTSLSNYDITISPDGGPSPSSITFVNTDNLICVSFMLTFDIKIVDPSSKTVVRTLTNVSAPTSARMISAYGSIWILNSLNPAVPGSTAVTNLYGLIPNISSSISTDRYKTTILGSTFKSGIVLRHTFYIGSSTVPVTTRTQPFIPDVYRYVFYTAVTVSGTVTFSLTSLPPAFSWSSTYSPMILVPTGTTTVTITNSYSKYTVSTASLEVVVTTTDPCTLKCVIELYNEDR